MRYAAMLIGCAILAGCNSEPDVDMKNASVGDVAKEVSESSSGESFVRPGKWESTVQFVSMDAPGMPDSVKSAMQGMNDRRTVFTTCLKPDEVKKPKEDFFAGKDNKECRYDHFRMGDGKIDAVMRCTRQGGGQVMQLQGTYSPESYSMQMAMKADGGQGPAKDMTMKMRVDAKRVGECDGKEG
jgi:hypothetical protein